MTRLLLIITCIVAGASSAVAQAPGLRAGAYAQDVTPKKFPISVNGSFNDRQAVAAHDPLHARCLVLESQGTKVAVVVVDSCMIPRELLDAAKALAEKSTQIPARNILISATHTHSAPTVAGVFQSEPDKDYVKFLTHAIAEGIEKANTRLAPAKLAWGVADEPHQVFNRRWRMKAGVKNLDPFGRDTDQVKMNPPRMSPDLLEPAGPTDPAVTVLSIRTADDKPLALFANYSLHYVGDMPPLSADYFGVFADVIATKLQASNEFVAMLSNGTSGDVNNINFKAETPKTKPGERSRVVAEAVAAAAMKAIDKKDHTPQATLNSATQEIELGVRKPTAEEIQRAKTILAKAQGRELRGAEEVYARETVLLKDYPDRVRVPLQVLQVGDAAVVAIPCETFAEIGLSIKKKSPFATTCVVSLANGYFGYLPTPQQHQLGGYETWRARSSFLEVEASTKIEQTILGLLRQLHAEK